jgi:alpha-galactosidase
VELEVKYDRFRRLEAIADGDGIKLDPGKELASEWALLSLSLDPLSAQKNFYRVWGQAMNARKGRPLKGWCSWYYYYWNITEQNFNYNLKECEVKLKDQLDLFQLDDGYERWPGEWLDWNKKFPSRPDQLVDKIHQAGFKAGIWMAPFVISRTAPLARLHPDWILRKESGRPVFAHLHPQWRGRIMYALDCTHPGVKDWLKDTINTVVHKYGFDFLKLDFIYAAALPGKRHDPYSTGAMAFRQGLEAIRDAAGHDVTILGCGAPFGPSIGLVDAMRTSQDVDIHWRYPGMDMLMGWPLTPSARNCFRNNLARSLMHGALWCNDPDCLVLREVKRGMNIREIQSEVTLFYLLGGYLLVSEDLRLLPQDKPEGAGGLDLLLKMIPLSEGTAEPLDLFLTEFPEVFFQKGDLRSLLALFNWSDRARLMKLELKKIGLSGLHHVFEFWSRRYLGQTEGTMDLGMVPPHSCKYLALTRVRTEKEPQMVGLDFHLGMGTAGLERFEVRPGRNEIDLALNLPGKRKGSLWIATAHGKGARETPVEFKNTLKKRIKL